MAEVKMKYDEYHRAAIAGMKFDDCDNRNVGAWTTDRAQAVKDASRLLVFHGTTKNYLVQSRIMLDDQALFLNSQRMQMTELRQNGGEGQ